MGPVTKRGEVRDEISRNSSQYEFLELHHPWADNSELPSARSSRTPCGLCMLYVISVYLLKPLPVKRLAGGK